MHYFPGLVLGTGVAFEEESFPWWFKLVFRYGKPLFRLAPSALGDEESGERVLFCASGRFPPRDWIGGGGGGNGREIGVAESSDGVIGGGAYRVNWNGEPVALGKQYKQMRIDGWKEKCVEHTLKAWADIDATGHFTG